MAKTRRPLQLDDLNDGDLVEFDRGEGHRTRGIYRGFHLSFTPVRWWLIHIEQPDGTRLTFLSRSAKSVRVLKPAERTEA